MPKHIYGLRFEILLTIQTCDFAPIRQHINFNVTVTNLERILCFLDTSDTLIVQIDFYDNFVLKSKDRNIILIWPISASLSKSSFAIVTFLLLMKLVMFFWVFALLVFCCHVINHSSVYFLLRHFAIRFVAGCFLFV